jgi:hypothetical protein
MIYEGLTGSDELVAWCGWWRGQLSVVSSESTGLVAGTAVCNRGRFGDGAGGSFDRINKRNRIF